jgi:pyridoxamine 5'-phosphate oxidase
MNERELSRLRQEYAAGGLSEGDLEKDPVAMFRRWLHEAVTAGLHEPNAMVVATVSADGRPSSRMVLLKRLDERGFVFFTNYDSRKGTELAANPVAALLFPWHDLERQVRIEGPVTPLAPEENAAYFATRPRASQLGAWASPQSQVVASRTELDQRYDAVANRFPELQDVPVPPHWGGYLVVPDLVEFWQGRRGRMHDRLRYRRTSATDGAGTWSVERLAP